MQLVKKTIVYLNYTIN